MVPPRGEYEERRAVIVQSATQVFAQKGYAATNREIAAAAGVTAAAIYWYFPSKEALFRAVAGQVRGRAEEALAELHDLDYLPPREALLRLATGFLGAISRPPIRDVVRMLFLEFGRHPELFQLYFQEVIGPVSDRIFGYFQRQMELGNFRPVPTAALGLSFIGPLSAMAIFREVLGQPFPPLVEPEQAVAVHVDTFLNGALAGKG